MSLELTTKTNAVRWLEKGDQMMRQPARPATGSVCWPPTRTLSLVARFNLVSLFFEYFSAVNSREKRRGVVVERQTRKMGRRNDVVESN